ncbi:MAG: DUF4395 family protein [Actinobacteria bacterium]|uniref:Unannotated protein n=1 Tax=freshwater metagenome TaxID=449393 RepID=A0A6J7D722_9ZZZZ|nr:DUF4395 family protein [Actinomycetota bacterium]
MSNILEQKTNSVSIDSRGPRFSAGLTTIVLASALVTSQIWIVIVQAIIFAIGATKGPQFTPYAVIFKKFIKPRLNGKVILEDVRPPKFAQSIGLLFALAAIAGSITGIAPLFTVAISFALAAAFLNAAFSFCLGCELYLIILRVRFSHG